MALSCRTTVAAAFSRTATCRLTRASVSACLNVAGSSVRFRLARPLSHGNLIDARSRALLVTQRPDSRSPAAVARSLVGAATLYDSTISGNKAQATQGPAFGGGLLVFGQRYAACQQDHRQHRDVRGRPCLRRWHPRQGGAVVSRIFDGKHGQRQHCAFGFELGLRRRHQQRCVQLCCCRPTVDFSTARSAATRSNRTAYSGFRQWRRRALVSIRSRRKYSTIDDNSRALHATACRHASPAGGGLAIIIGSQSGFSISSDPNATFPRTRPSAERNLARFAFGGGLRVGRDKPLRRRQFDHCIQYASTSGGGIDGDVRPGHCALRT